MRAFMEVGYIRWGLSVPKEYAFGRILKDDDATEKELGGLTHSLLVSDLSQPGATNIQGISFNAF